MDLDFSNIRIKKYIRVETAECYIGNHLQFMSCWKSMNISANLLITADGTSMERKIWMGTSASNATEQTGNNPATGVQGLIANAIGGNRRDDHYLKVVQKINWTTKMRVTIWCYRSSGWPRPQICVEGNQWCP